MFNQWTRHFRFMIGVKRKYSWRNIFNTELTMFKTEKKNSTDIFRKFRIISDNKNEKTNFDSNCPWSKIFINVQLHTQTVSAPYKYAWTTSRVFNSIRRRPNFFGVAPVRPSVWVALVCMFLFYFNLLFCLTWKSNPFSPFPHPSLWR